MIIVAGYSDRGNKLKSEKKNVLFHVIAVKGQVEIERNVGNRKGPVIVPPFVWQQLKYRGGLT